jgi:hypothetical protein
MKAYFFAIRYHNHLSNARGETGMKLPSTPSSSSSASLCSLLDGHASHGVEQDGDGMEVFEPYAGLLIYSSSMAAHIKKKG